MAEAMPGYERLRSFRRSDDGGATWALADRPSTMRVSRTTRENFVSDKDPQCPEWMRFLFVLLFR